ncbi:hypothetical protein JPH1_13980 [Mycobacterium avium subsp. hominissuis]|uniref:Uncharacterized protein n=1 Tax=Mycobacterium avium subsp. hominissuis TaxID=439334 RepID=A0AAI8X1R3_MYCAV|nr:hypothetical protein JPH1_13980 [Mycobacterium avium subsp. hominissuis]
MLNNEDWAAGTQFIADRLWARVIQRLMSAGLAAIVPPSVRQMPTAGEPRIPRNAYPIRHLAFGPIVTVSP